MLKINFDYNGKNIILVYANNGKLEYVIDSESDKKMMIQYTQVGSGYINESIPINVCNAVYVKIMELDLFVPKFIFIPNNKIKE